MTINTRHIKRIIYTRTVIHINIRNGSSNTLGFYATHINDHGWIVFYLIELLLANILSSCELSKNGQKSSKVIRWFEDRSITFFIIASVTNLKTHFLKLLKLTKLFYLKCKCWSCDRSTVDSPYNETILFPAL